MKYLTRSNSPVFGHPGLRFSRFIVAGRSSLGYLARRVEASRLLWLWAQGLEVRLAIRMIGDGALFFVVASQRFCRNK